ncbi:hypothetical protein R83H12_01733 [Fibrobacteria bacterium R8-3-H12]
MTDQELKDLVASFAIDRKESSAEFDRRMQEADRQRKESEAAFNLRMEKLDKKLDKLCDDIGGISNNMGHHAEQFFQDVFKKKLEFGGVKYDEMVPNLAHKSKKDDIEFDIALVNGDSVALIEVKNRIHPDFVKILAEERIEKFRKFFREFDDYDVYLGIAGFSFSDEVIDRASAYGIGIIKQVGEGVEIKADNLRVY